MNTQLAGNAQVPAGFVNNIVTESPPPPPHLAAVRGGVEIHEAFLQVSCTSQPREGGHIPVDSRRDRGSERRGFCVPSRAQRQAPLCRRETRASGSVLACPPPPAHHPQRCEAALTLQFPHSRAIHTLVARALHSPWQTTGAEAALGVT